MSVVFLSNGEPTGEMRPLVSKSMIKLTISPVTSEQIQVIASSNNFKIPEEDEKDYLFLLNSLDATLTQVADLPAYVDPRLKPEEGTLPRTWKKAKENPLNAWACQVSERKCYGERIDGSFSLLDRYQITSASRYTFSRSYCSTQRQRFSCWRTTNRRYISRVYHWIF